MSVHFMIHTYLSRSSRDLTRIENGRWFSYWRCREKMSLDARHSSRRKSDRRSDEKEWKLLSIAYNSWNNHWEKDRSRFIYRAHAQSPFFVHCISDMRCNSSTIGAGMQTLKNYSYFRIEKRVFVVFEVQTIENWKASMKIKYQEWKYIKKPHRLPNSCYLSAYVWQ